MKRRARAINLNVRGTSYGGEAWRLYVSVGNREIYVSTDGLPHLSRKQGKRLQEWLREALGEIEKRMQARRILYS